MNRLPVLLLLLFGLSACGSTQTKSQLPNEPSNSNIAPVEPTPLASIPIDTTSEEKTNNEPSNSNIAPVEPTPLASIPIDTTSEEKTNEDLTFSKSDFDTENHFLSIMLRENAGLDKSPELIGEIRNGKIEKSSGLDRPTLEEGLMHGYKFCYMYMDYRNKTHKTYSEFLTFIYSLLGRQDS